MNVDDDDKEMDDMADLDMPEETGPLFWSMKVEPGKATDIDQPAIPNYIVHITNACFGPTVQKGSRSVVMVTTTNEDDDADDAEGVPICILRAGSGENQSLDLLFNESASMTVKGNKPSTVYLTGYLQPPLNSDDFGGAMDPMMEDMDEEQVMAALREQKRQQAALDDEDEDDDDDDDDEEQEPSVTKNGGVGADDDDDDEDEDDDDDEEGDDEEDADEEDEDSEPEEPPTKKQKTGKGPKATANKKGAKKGDDKKRKTPPKKAAAKKPAKKQEAKKPAAKEAAEEEVKPQKKGKKEKSKVDKKLKPMVGGMKFRDMATGKGERAAKKGDRVSVYYVGQTQDKEVFDKSITGSGFEFTLGAGEVIKGWDLGVKGMKVGGKRKLVIPPKMAYGADGSPPSIPPHATLTFTIQLKAFK